MKAFQWAKHSHHLGKKSVLVEISRERQHFFLFTLTPAIDSLSNHLLLMVNMILLFCGIHSGQLPPQFPNFILLLSLPLEMERTDGGTDHSSNNS